MKPNCLFFYACLAVLIVANFPTPRGRAAEPATRQLTSFERKRLTDTYFSEGIAAGDLNQDGVDDVVYGPYWFAGPEYEEKHEIYPPKPQPRDGYADNFFSWIYDFDGDGWNDVLVAGFPGTPAYVYRNPGEPTANESHWEKHQVFDWVSNESPQFTNIYGDERPELICTRDGMFGFVTIDWDNPLGDWSFRPISEKITATRFGHGLGVGDINGDGRQDLIHAGGWFEQPLENAGNSRWKHHKVRFSDQYGGAEMYAYDVDGDGDNDVITSLAAHEFGLAWYEQAIDEAGNRTFTMHRIMGSQPKENAYGVVFSELHSVGLADINGDGLKDIVTGKTYYSHHQQSPMWDAGAVVYWFELKQGDDGVEWVPHKADDEAGIGRQLLVHDINDDGLLDILAGGMKGAHLLTHNRREVDLATWEAAQPEPYVPEEVSDADRPDAVGVGLEGEQMQVLRATAGQPRSQPMGNFSAGRWSNNAQLWWTAGNDGEQLDLALPIAQAGTTELFVGLTKARDYGIVQFLLDGKPIGKPIDGYSSPDVVSTKPISLGEHELSEGRHTLSAKVTGTNPSAVKSYMVGIDYVALSNRKMLKTGTGELLPYFAGRPEPEKPPAPDNYPHAGLAADKAAAAMQLPDNFRVTASASEPAVKQPIAMALDDRGRVWIAEAYEYPRRAAEGEGNDRILIFEDTTGDGKLDHRTVFADGLNLVSGLEVGFGGVFVGAAPYLLFIPDADQDDVPDAEPQILLDGWGYQDTHETLNAFIWGPDGWLYGCHGVFTHSNVGKPGTPDDQRVPLNAGIWRYHPTRHQFEVFAEGTSNPWGVDFNDHGQAFITACVIPHLYHVIQGARYQRQAGSHFNPYTYDDIKTIADHRHYVGATPHSGNGRSDDAGGGHAHAGAMIYLGDAWPAEYRDQLFMNNIHGQRLNVDTLKPDGSGYVGSHGPDFLLTGDQASQILNLRYGPDGNAFMIDWYDMQACHERDSTKHDRNNGRIYKIDYGDPAPVSVNLAEATDQELVELVLHPNDWYVRHSRRLLQERYHSSTLESSVRDWLTEIATTHADPTRRLRAMWVLHVTGGLAPQTVGTLLTDGDPNVRGWTIQLALDTETTSERSAVFARLAESFGQMAAEDESPVVRLYLASALQRAAPDQRWEILTALASHAEDADDHNLPLMLWYSAEPLAETDVSRAFGLAIATGDTMPLLQQNMLRRIASIEGDQTLAVLVQGLGDIRNPQLQETVLTAIRAALRGRRRVEAPTGWREVYENLEESQSNEVRREADALGVVFGDSEAMRRMREQAANSALDPDRRRAAIDSLLAAGDQALPPLLLRLLNDPPMRGAALAGLSQYEVPGVAANILGIYDDLSQEEQRTAMATLTSRAETAVAVLQAIEKERLPSTALSADLVRQLHFLKDPRVDELLTSVWGSVRETPQERVDLIGKYKDLVERTKGPKPDLVLGRSIYSKTCQQCHKLYAVGGDVGPDLTGSNRSDLDYLLSNIVDPSAVMAKEYQPTVVLTVDGRVITGLLKSENSRSLTLQTADAQVILPKDEIEDRQLSDQSMMPDDQLKQFSDHDVRSLIAYLRGKEQVELPTPAAE